MNPPQVYMCSPPWTLLPPHSIPLGRPSAPAPSIQYRAHYFLMAHEEVIKDIEQEKYIIEEFMYT